jgi:hypothetical protein
VHACNAAGAGTGGRLKGGNGGERRATATAAAGALSVGATRRRFPRGVSSAAARLRRRRR